MGTLIDDIREEFAAVTHCVRRPGKAVPPGPAPAPVPPRTYEIRIEVVDATDPARKIQNITLQDTSVASPLPNVASDGAGRADFTNIPDNHTRTFRVTGFDETRYRLQHATYSFHPVLPGGAIHRIAIVPIIRIYLKLQFKDPEDHPRNFPENFALVMRVEHPAGNISVAVGADGIINHNGHPYVELDRSVRSFRLDFHQSHEMYLVCEKQGDAVAETLLENLPQINARINHDMNNLAGFRAIKLPQTTWTLANSEWGAVGALPAFNTHDHKFDTLQDPATVIGAPGNPAALQLNMHWQFTRFTYYDRWIKGENKMSILPIMLEGFMNASHTGSHADTKSNWVCRAGVNLLQVLPWIIQESGHVRPDDNILLGFETLPNTFIESPVDKSVANRKLINGTEQNTPNADRLRFYDLPLHWKSQKYFCRIPTSAADPSPVEEKFFEDLTNRGLVVGQPLTFCLDDIVLVDDHLTPIPHWKPDAHNRFAIFSHLFNDKEYDGTAAVPGALSGQLGPEGVYKPDNGNKKSFFTITPAVAAHAQKNYIVDYPDWTRLVVAGGNMFDVFANRTSPGSGHTVGARAAVRWHRSAGHYTGPDHQLNHRPALDNNSHHPFFAIQPFYEQKQDWWADHNGSTGRVDMAFLRCCDCDNNDEIAFNLHFTRTTFHYPPLGAGGLLQVTPPAVNPHTGLPTVFNEAPDPNPAFAAGIAPIDFENEVMINVNARWNGKDAVNSTGQNGRKNGTLLLPKAPAATPIRVSVIWISQVLANNLAHIRVDVTQPTGDPEADRDNRDGVWGTGMSLTNHYRDTGSDFATAHECGHVDCLPDEYNESFNAASYDQLSLRYNLPGDPYRPDRNAMMVSDQEIRNRYFWQCAEWVRRILGNVSLVVNHDTYPNYWVPPHERPERSYNYWPIEQKVNYEAPDFLASDNITTIQNRGNINLFLYTLGEDKFAKDILPTLFSTPPPSIGGVLIVIINLRFHMPVWAVAQSQIDNRQHILEAVMASRLQLNSKFYLIGKVRDGSDQEWEFDDTQKRAHFWFSPRVVVENHEDTHLANDVIHSFHPQLKITVVKSPHNIDSIDWVASHPAPEVISDTEWMTRSTAATPERNNINTRLANYHTLHNADLHQRINSLIEIVNLCGVHVEQELRNLKRSAEDRRAYLLRCAASKELRIEFNETDPSWQNNLQHNFEPYLPGFIGIYKIPADITVNDFTPWLNELNITNGQVKLF